MLDIIKNSFKLTNKYIILATPLILLSLISGLYIIFSSNGNTISLIFAFILFFLMLCAFLSGWLFMIKKCITDDEQEPGAMISEFPAGVGEYFLPVCGMIVISLIIAFCTMAAAYYIGVKAIGDIKEVLQALSSASSSAEALKSYLSTLSVEELVKLNLWNVLLFCTAILTYFVLMFYSPALFYKTRNPFIALIKAFKDLFCRKFFKNLLAFMFVFVTYFVLSIFSAATPSNIFIHFIFTLINFYYMVFAVVFIYDYYYKNYVQIGANIDTRV